MQNAASIAWSWTSGVQPDIRGMSEKYLSHNTDDQVADIFTKPLQTVKYSKFVKGLSLS